MLMFGITYRTAATRLTARAYDDSNAVGISTASAISVSTQPTPNLPPSVSIVSPRNDTTYYSPASVRLYAIATDPDGTISKVEFYNGTTLIGTENLFPYDRVWANVPNGTYAITAKAYDNSGAFTYSTVSTINRQKRAAQKPLRLKSLLPVP
jgi:hypothetical protein